MLRLTIDRRQRVKQLSPFPGLARVNHVLIFILCQNEAWILSLRVGRQQLGPTCGRGKVESVDVGLGLGLGSVSRLTGLG